jgi:hypothetical protein
MKTIIKNDISLYVFDDNEYVKIENDFIQIGYPPKFLICDCNLSNTVLIENVLPPSDWVGYKYFFDGVTWTLNSEYIVEPPLEYSN